MKAVLFALACTIAVVAAVSDSNESIVMLQEQFAEWTVQYNKQYANNEEWLHAFNNYQASIERVARLNAEDSGAQFHLGKFADLSPEEFKAKYLNLKTDKLPKLADFEQFEGGLLQADANGIDWRDKGMVTPVKDQGQCGSCWAFSITETTESNYAIQSKKPIPVLAPEQLVDCDKTDWGCDGGIVEYAWKYLIKAGGQMAEVDYPYTAGKSGRPGTCRFVGSKVIAPVRNFTWVGKPCQYVGDSCDHQDDKLVEDALTNVGPLSVCVNANWQDYHSGVFSGRCAHDAGSMNHAVQLVGWNGDQPTNQYWIVRNSWNTNWGVGGYIYIKKGANLCGVSNIVSYPRTA
jgi:cathepsin F